MSDHTADLAGEDGLATRDLLPPGNREIAELTSRLAVEHVKRADLNHRTQKQIDEGCCTGETGFLQCRLCVVGRAVSFQAQYQNAPDDPRKVEEERLQPGGKLKWRVETRGEIQLDSVN